MDIIEFLDKHTDAIFGLLGAILGFISNVVLQKWNQKFEVIKETGKGYFQKKQTVLTKSLQLIYDYETAIKTLHDFGEDAYGRPIAKLEKEDIYTEHFIRIFGYLHSHRFYLDEETIKKLDKIGIAYHDYLTAEKVIVSEYSEDDIQLAVTDAKKKLYETTQVLFHGVLEEIKYDEVNKLKNKMKVN